MRRRWTDLDVVAALAVLAAAAAAALPASLVVVRAPLAVALVLVLPGYALTAALFTPARLRPAERAVVTVALSIAATILVGLLLYLVGIRLKATPWTELLAAIAVVGTAEARRRGHAQRLQLHAARLNGPEVAAIAASVLLLGAAAAVGFSPLAAPKGTEAQSVVWVAPKTAQSVRFGVISEQLRTTSYTVEVLIGSRPPLRFGQIRLAPGATWTRAAATGSGSPRVRVLLRRVGGGQSVYRYALMQPGWWSRIH